MGSADGMSAIQKKRKAPYFRRLFSLVTLVPECIEDSTQEDPYQESVEDNVVAYLITETLRSIESFTIGLELNGMHLLSFVMLIPGERELARLTYPHLENTTITHRQTHFLDTQYNPYIYRAVFC